MSLKSINESFNRQFSEIDKSIKEDTIKQNGKWVNKGKEGTHGKFKTKKAADAQRKAMFANGYKAESLKESSEDKLVIYKSLGKYRVTPESNYNARVQNARKVQKLDDFESADEIIDYYVKYGWANGKDDFKVIEESKKITERNLNRAERHNRDMSNIFDRKKGYDRKFADFLKKNGYSDDEIERLRKSDSLSKEIANKFTPDGKQPSEILGKILKEADDVEYEKKYYSAKRPDGSGEIDYWEVERPKNPKDWGRGERNRTFLDRKEWQKRAFGINENESFGDSELEKEQAKDCIQRESLKENKWSNKWPRYVFTFDDGWKISAVDENEAVAKYDDIQKNLYNGTRLEKELDNIAQELYDSNDGWSFNYFSDNELAILWALAFNRAYDDEVYNAITNRPNEEEIFTKAKEVYYSKVDMDESLTESKKLTESFDDMEVFMNTWANYNEYGADGVLTPTGWMSIDEAIEYCEEYADYEPFINDTDNVPFDVSEYSNASSVLIELKELQESNVDEDVVEAIVEAGGYDVKEAVEIAERGDYYFYPDVHDYSDLAYAVIDEIGSFGDALGDRITNYIDEDQMRREYRWDIREIMRDSAEDEVDREHSGEVDISKVPTSKEFSIDEWFDEDDEYTEDDLREQISDDLEYEYDSAPVSFDIEVSNDGKKVTAKNIEWDGYDREQEIEDWMDEHEEEYLDSIISEEISLAEAGEIDLSNYFDYEAFGRDLSYDGYTFTDKGAILIY
ncbi:MAG: hypothetical protein J6T10_16125 [Methanobrevibacter sp.]|nr:hypothetical protein [Methanobrevibacter sp.]